MVDIFMKVGVGIPAVFENGAGKTPVSCQEFPS
jgi:hypothetical protein